MVSIPSRSIASIAVALALSGCDRDVPTGPWARAKVIEQLDDSIGGTKGLARPGDFALENDKFRVNVLSGRTSTGPGLYGGSVVDGDLQWADPALRGGHGLDQFNEMFPTVNMNTPKSGSPPDVFVLKDGKDGGDAVVRVEGPGEPFLSMLSVLWGLVGMPGMWTTTDYTVQPGVPWMKVSTVVTLAGEADIPVVKPVVGDVPPTPISPATGSFDVLGIALSTGVAMGDFWLAGGSVDVFGPGIGFDEDGAVYRKMIAGENTFQQPFEFPFLAAVGDGVSYGIAAADGNLFVPLFTASQTVVIGGGNDGTLPSDKFRFPANTQFSYDRYFFVGDGDVGSIVDQYVEARKVPHGTVTGHVFEQGTSEPLSKIDVFVYKPGDEYPFSQWRTDHRADDGLADGSFGGSLPVGDWELMVHQHGRPTSDRLPIAVREGEESTVQLEALRGGVLTFTVHDQTGEKLPAKVTLFRKDDNTATSNRPDLGDPYIGGQPEWVLFAETGEGEIPLPPGDYYAVASRGLEYEIDRSDDFHIDALQGKHLDLTVDRSIDTSGWVSADFHVHSAPSHDSGVSLPMRVKTMAAEGVEFFAATDHDYISDFAPVIQDLGLENWVQSTPGVETTTIEIGHYLAFPLQKQWLGDVGGAMDWTGKLPEQIIAELRKQGTDAGFDPFVFLAHPRDGLLGGFDQYGFDPFGGAPNADGTPGAMAYSTPLLNSFNPLISDFAPPVSMDGIELFTGKRLDVHRKPTKPEQDGYAADDGTDAFDFMSRTMQEQTDLVNGTYRLSNDLDGNVDDWFTLLNLGYRFTALGNSDTHGTSSIEAGCPRNYVLSETDDPAYLDPQTIADSVRDHHVVASYGPFLRMWINGAEIGSSIESKGKPLQMQIEVQAPSWVAVDRVELYENGTLVQEWAVPDAPSNERFNESFEWTPTKDAWYVAIAMGEKGLDPVFTRVDIPYLPLDEVVISALGGLPAVQSFLSAPIPFPKEYPVYPYALTNPIWVDVDGGGFMPAGRPAWLIPAASE